MAVIVSGNEIVLTGTVGGYYWAEDGFSSAEVFMALLSVGRTEDVVIRINSGGGAASEGAAIHSVLINHGGRVDVVVEGWAASAASLLAMAGETVTMSVGAVMMIHDPASITFGDAAEHLKKVNELNAIGDAAAEIYAKKTGKPVSEMRELMKAERWLTGSEAVSEGFADRIGSAAEPSEIEPVPYAIQSYMNVPEKITAIASARGWKDRGSKSAVSAAQTSQTKEKSVTDKERADQLAAELAELKATSKANADALAALQTEKEDRERKDAIMALPEADGRKEVAATLAAAPGMTLETAKTILAASPKTSTAADDDAAELERRRLNSAGLKGKVPSTAAQPSPLLANMKKLLGKEAA